MWLVRVAQVLISILIVLAIVWLRAHFAYWRLVFAVINRTIVLSLFLPMIVLLLWGLVGRGLGITNLFWNDTS